MATRDNDLNHICAICGTAYHACDDCTKLKEAGIESWRIRYDRPECYKVGEIIRWHRHKIISNAEAIEMLSAINLDDVFGSNNTDARRYVASLGVQAQESEKQPSKFVKRKRHNK